MLNLHYFVKKRKLKRGLDRLVYLFVNDLENHNKFNDKLYNKILEISDALNKKLILDNMIREIELFDDYDNNEVNFNYKKYLEGLKNDN